MTPNRIYQAVVEALETSLAPRVVSLVLREGLVQVERDPSNLQLDDVEAILTGPVFKQLQARMSADEAREAVTSFRERIEAQVDPSSRDGDDAAARDDADADADRADAGAGAPAAGSSVEQRLEALRAALRPFNLYFDWPEVRKLRAQLQVADGELASGVAPGDSLDAADEQLRLVEQKLEDRLVMQARELGELEEALEIVQTLGGPRVRRLESLIGQIRHAQRSRELADAETERAATLARDLRKLMESSVAQPFAPVVEAEAQGADVDAPPPSDALAAGEDDLPPVRIDEAQLTPEVSERLRALDVDGERRTLDALAEANADLLRYAPGLAAGLDAARATLDQGLPLGDELDALRRQLADATDTQRSHLGAELAAIEADLERLGLDDDGSLERSLRVALDVLSEGLPAHADVVALRELHQGALVRREERERRELDARALVERKRAQQRALLERITRTLDDDAAADAATSLDAPSRALRSALEALDEAESEDRLDEGALERGLQAEQRWEHALAERSDDDEVRRRARLRELEARLEGLPDLPSLRARAESLRAECANAGADESLDDAHLATLSSLVDQLHADALDAVSHHLERLAQDAGDASDREVLGALQAGARTLQAGRFPDIERLQALVVETRERLRDAERVRWQRLQHASARLEPAGVPGLPALTRALASVRSLAAEGRPITPALDAAEAALEQVEAEVRDRLATFAPRLDAALATFARVQRLNTDEVATVRRVLTHLDTQRDALGRISPGLQHQLERSLHGAEQLLEGLAEAFEATRAVADQLVSANLFDDMLGFFDTVSATSDAGASDDAAGTSWRDSEALQALLAGFRGFDDVDAALVIGSDGTLRAGDAAGLDLGPIADALRGATATWSALGERLEDAEPELVDLALGSRHALLAPLGREAHALVLVRSDGAVSALTARLRDKRGAMVAAVAAAAT